MSWEPIRPQKSGRRVRCRFRKPKGSYQLLPLATEISTRLMEPNASVRNRALPGIDYLGSAAVTMAA